MTHPEPATDRAVRRIDTQVCVIGGGPAGLMLALALARRGRSVVVLEQSAKYTRHFRGESISPDSVLLFDRFGLLPEIEKRLDLEQTYYFEVSDGGRRVLRIDFRELRRGGFLPVELPQQILLDVLSEAAAAHQAFTLLRQVTMTDLIEEGGRVAGARCVSPDGDLEVRADLTIGADGRFSRALKLSGLACQVMPLERDVLWFTLPFPEDWERNTVRVRIDRDRHALLLHTTPNLVRVGLNIPKGGLREFRAQGIEAMHARLASLAPELEPAAKEQITSWSNVHLLDIFTSKVPRWSRPGLILIGDAAHTLSPILGQGVNQAIIDAVTLAPMISAALGARDRQAELSSVAKRFQELREGDVGRARRIQLAQERAFALSGPLAVTGRQTAYRLIESQGWLKRYLWRRVYYTLQP